MPAYGMILEVACDTYVLLSVEALVGTISVIEDDLLNRNFLVR